ncbi:MAG: hypothetical protein EOO31_02800 [Comamonadaceae bacterium]|nr:MAG: hypothetical protein EOO31_02800 [Comamonadaceae bacterium]
MRPIFAGIALAALSATAFADDWFSVYGDPVQEGAQDLIQIRPASISRGDHLTIEVRVTRSAVREAYGGGKYRGHHSTAQVDCSRNKAWYTQMKFYGEPQWAGPVIMSRSFEPGQAPVVFKDIPGQAERLVRAACRLPK